MLVVNFSFKTYRDLDNFVLQRALRKTSYNDGNDVCECVLFAGENLAVQGKASQSSLYSTLTAYNAIDGNRDSVRNSCSCTDNDFNPWWRLDLGKTHKIFSVKITNRDSYSNRLNGAEIRIGDSLERNGNNNPR